MSFPRYAKYKDSGVEWLGEIPQHWEVWKLAHAFALVGSGTTPKSDNRDYYDDGNVPWINTGDLNDGELDDCERRITTLALAQHTSLKMYPAGSLVIAMYGATIGKLAMVRFPATVNQACCVFAGTSAIVPKFMFYWFIGLRQKIISLATGGGQPNISQDILRGLRVACPKDDEQTQIVSFLDGETAKVDELVAEQRRLIELLKEKRQVVVSHAVTKGLNPHSPLKPSGVDWLGSVPEDWEVRRLSNVCNFQAGKPHEPFIDGEGEFICVNSRFVSTGGKSRKFCSKNLTPAQRNDILMVMSDLPNGRALAKAYFVDDNGPYAVNQRVCALSPRKGSPKFLFYLLNRNQYFLQYDDGINQTHLPNSVFEKFQAPIPPVPQQIAIAAFLDRETTQIDILTAEAQHAIDLLQERRASLIYAAVTGQINVCRLVDAEAA